MTAPDLDDRLDLRDGEHLELQPWDGDGYMLTVSCGTAMLSKRFGRLARWRDFLVHLPEMLEVTRAAHAGDLGPAEEWAARHSVGWTPPQPGETATILEHDGGSWVERGQTTVEPAGSDDE